MTGKFLAGFILVCGLLGGVAVYYLQVYAYYEEVEANGMSDVVLVENTTNNSISIVYSNFKGIDAQSSPIRYRACFTTQVALEELQKKYVEIDNAVPLHAPGWFDCFDAEEIGAAIEAGEAISFLALKDVTYGIDRVATIFPDGRGFAWTRINRCGEKAFDGKPVPPDCPQPPERD